MRILLTAVLCIFAFQTADHSQSTPAPTHRIVLPGDLKWQSGGAGTSYADVLGNPDNPGLYMFFSKGPDGAILQPHWHSRDENVTVLSGTFMVGIGAGGYILIPGNVHHFCKIKGETVWEIFGEGPFTYDEVKPAS
jgi:anti-sigma factor ChrR (cupin superfamily)